MDQPSFQLRPQNRQPEATLQKRVAAMLRAYMPDEVWWTASLSGVRLSPAMAGAAKSAGMQKGAPDLSFVFPDGETRYIELKDVGGQLTPEQARLARTLVHRMAVCRSWEQARCVLEDWLEPFGLRLLTDAESVRRAGRRSAA